MVVAQKQKIDFQDFLQQDKQPLHTSVLLDVMQMRLDFSLSAFEQQQFIAAIKSGIYQELYQSGLLTEDQADRLITGTRPPLARGGQTHVGE